MLSGRKVSSVYVEVTIRFVLYSSLSPCSALAASSFMNMSPVGTITAFKQSKNKKKKDIITIGTVFDLGLGLALEWKSVGRLCNGPDSGHCTLEQTNTRKRFFFFYPESSF